ncbi:MAX dimerization protein MGA a isoform X2 [Solea solea]|uniref:MAX dimerization protein MGA a isoform X2 n=1 Tax=Solea solea TaxID=90069 RepID=UPI00272CE3FC|nr:MAX dimerization protein MGA a isoform X2 [Solea solea]
MACKKKKQKGMVFHQEGATSSAAPPAAKHPPAHCVLPKPEKACEGGRERSGHVKVTNREANMTGKGFRTPGALPAVKHLSSPSPLQDNLSPVSMCRGVRVTLDNNSMWNEFFRCRTEMILTKQGSRMFPYCRFRVSGLQPSRKYCLLMDVQLLDNSRYRWTGRSWQVAGKAESHVKSRLFSHPESPSTGQHWMQSPVSFYRLKLTNSVSDQEGNIALHPMHRYLPRLHIIQTDKAAKDVKLTGASVVTFTFPQTEFLAVAAYQNSRFAQLIVDHNPFAKGLKEDSSGSSGLKLKLNSGKETPKEEAKGTSDHPVKKSLKSLLANHKPKGSKAVVPKSSGSGETANKDPSRVKVPAESLCSTSRPAQKLFSELIREAHVSLQRCNLDQLNINNGTSLKTELTNGPGVPEKNETHSKTSSAQRKAKSNRNCLNVQTSKDGTRKDYSEVTHVVTDPPVSQTSVDSDHRPKPEAPSEENVKQQQKRPAPLPLPALALFLKQHSTKSKRAKNKMDAPPPALPPESESHSSDATAPSNNLVDDEKCCNKPSSGHAVTDVDASEPVVEAAPPSHPESAASTETTAPGLDDSFVSVSIPECLDSNQAGPDHTTVLCTLGTCMSTMSSPLATSAAACPVLSPPLDTVLNALNSPQTPPIMESSTVPSDSPTMKSHLLLPDPECSSFGFEPLSPASSPEPLPVLPASLALELDSTSSELNQKPEPSNGSPQRDGSTTSVFKWHTVLPLPGPPYLDASFTTFQPTSQTLPLASVMSPLLPSPSPSTHEPQTSMTPDPDSALSLQDNEQSLPFPAELSPLVLQLSLSPTFSSLDGDPLSPTPSLTELVHFFSTNDDLGMEVEFSNSEAVVIPPPATPEAHVPEPVPARKPDKCRNKRRKPTVDMEEKVDESAYVSMQPNLEEVEEQLFISFTSKEALKLHVLDSVEEPLAQTTPDVPLLPPADTPDHETLQKSSSGEKLLLRDLQLMKHRQVIHPVLQEVGLKMNLLDPTLAIDLQYLGVRLPLPPPGHYVALQHQEPPPPQGVSAVFVSRTGKTTDVTQIKGWREKFTPSEAPPTHSSAKPEAGPSSDQPKKNLSAFCSDMLDEYLENEGKLIDERAASFSQPQAEPAVPVVYELPAQSSSYVRTLDNVLKKHGVSSPTSDLISGFIPPSKRPKLSLKERKTQQKRRGPKQTRLQPEPTSAPESTLEPSPAELNQLPKLPVGPLPPSDHLTPVTEPNRSQKSQLKVQSNHTEPSSESPESNTLKKKKKRRRRLKPNTSSQTLSALRATVSQDLAPLESDSELGRDEGKAGPPLMTRALLRQKDLEDGVVWEGQPRTTITKERAAIALTSLFTLMGFVNENPTAPIQLVRRRAPPCLNDFCRLGCICSSLAYSSRVGHCGRSLCMFGCSCLKQKVVLLKNLEASDSSPSHPSHSKRRKRKRRMKMAYVLKEADSVSQPAERVRVLWKNDGADSDPDPVYVPGPMGPTRLTIQQNREDESSCARVRGYRGKRQSQKAQDKNKSGKSKSVKSVKQQPQTLKEAPPPAPPPAAAETTESNPKPSKRLILLSECKWASDADRNHVLKRLCEMMAQDRLDLPFWVREYLISPISQNVEDNDGSRCVQYKVHIGRPRPDQEDPKEPPQQDQKTEPLQEQDLLTQVSGEAELLQGVQKEEPPEDWQREVEEGEIEEEEGSPCEQVDGESDMKERERSTRAEKKKKKKSLALPFLTGISPAGFLAARKKSAGETDPVVEVNGKLYPLAKIQLGKMGALHPANRLAAYLTGRVGSNRKQTQGPGPTPMTPRTPTVCVTSSNLPNAVTLPRPQPTVTRPLLHTSSTVSQVSSSVVPPVTLVPGLKFVPGPRMKVSVLGAASPSSGQRMLLQPLYRLSNGKLVQLVPINKPRAVSPAHFVSRGSQSATIATPPPSPSLSGLQSFSVSNCSFPLSPGSGFLSQKGTRTFKIIPASSNKEPIIITCQKPPSLPLKVALSPATVTSLKTQSPAPSADLISPIPSPGEEAEPGVRLVIVSNDTASGPISSLSSTPLETNHTVPPPPAAPGSKVTLAAPPSPAAPGSKVTLAVPPPPVAPGSKVTVAAPPPPVAPGSKVMIAAPPPPADPGSRVTLAAPPPPAAPGSKVTLAAPPPPAAPGSEVTLAAPPPPAALGSRVTLAGPPPRAAPRSRVTLAAPPPPAAPGSRVTLAAPPSPAAPGSQVALSSMDLDIICVDDDPEPVAMDTWLAETVGMSGSSSGDTDNSSDFEDDSDSGDDKETTKNHRHNLLERQRRGKMMELFTCLRKEVGLRDDKTPKVATLKKAVQMIQELRSTETNLMMKKMRLKDKRDEFLSTLVPAGESVHLSSKHDKKRRPAANPPPAEGGASDSDDDLIIISSNLPPKTPQTPPTNVSAPPTTTPVPTPVHKPVPVQQASSVAPPPVSCCPPVVRDRPRTVPNILSRRKRPQTVEVEAPPIKALVPPDFLSLVGAAFPGQQVVSVSPVMSEPSVLQTAPPPGVASVTLNLPSLTNQQIHVTSLLPPPTASQLLHMVQNSQQDSADCPLLASAGPDQDQNQVKDPDQNDTRAESPSSLSVGPGPGPDGGLSDPDPESLTSLLNEIVFLNQQTVATATTAQDCSEGGVRKLDHTHSPELDCDGTVTTETKEAGLQGHTDMTQSRPSTKGGVLAPPPLLQMKVGGANVIEPVSSDKAAVGGEGGPGKGDSTWRPMPRLVPLGLRGAPPT